MGTGDHEELADLRTKVQGLMSDRVGDQRLLMLSCEWKRGTTTHHNVKVAIRKLELVTTVLRYLVMSNTSNRRQSSIVDDSMRRILLDQLTFRISVADNHTRFKAENGRTVMPPELEGGVEVFNWSEELYRS